METAADSSRQPSPLAPVTNAVRTLLPQSFPEYSSSYNGLLMPSARQSSSPQSTVQVFMFRPNTPATVVSHMAVAPNSPSFPRILPAPSPGFRGNVYTLVPTSNPGGLGGRIHRGPLVGSSTSLQQVRGPFSTVIRAQRPNGLKQELMSSNVIVKRIPGTSQIVRSTPSQIVASRQFSHFSNTFQILPSVSGNQPSRIRTGAPSLIQSHRSMAGGTTTTSRILPTKAATKRRIGRPKKNQNGPQQDFAAEMSEIRSKIHSRYETRKKQTIKKEDVGYEGPYVKAYRCPEAAQGKIPVPNYIIDDLESHVTPTETNKQRLKLDKPTGVPSDQPLVCSFCHLDPNGERETGMGDLIGPIMVPASVRWPRKTGEDKAYAYVHAGCLEWSSNFQMIGFEIADPRALFEDAKHTCAICNRKGATLGCSAPGHCPKTFHYPCAKLKGYHLVPESHQTFCDDHKDIPAKKRKYDQSMADNNHKNQMDTE